MIDDWLATNTATKCQNSKRARPRQKALAPTARAMAAEGVPLRDVREALHISRNKAKLYVHGERPPEEKTVLHVRSRKPIVNLRPIGYLAR